MIDHRIYPLQNRLLLPMAQRLACAGVRADWLTLAGLPVALFAFLFLALGWFWLALGAIVLNRLLDGLDGNVARLEGPSDRGAFLDICLDTAFYALVPLGFAIADPATNALPAAVLLGSFMGTGSSFLAFSLIAERRKMTAADFPTKGIFYSGGLAEGTETVAFFVLFALFPVAFPWLAYAFASLCVVTVFLRWRFAARMFRTEGTIAERDAKHPKLL